jgi:large subunit ribosomal protein L6
MSRIGKKPVALPGGVTVTVNADELAVKGPKGNLSRKIVDGITITQEDNSVVVHRANDTSEQRARHGLMRALLANMVTGVSTGFEKKLQIIGVGYKADVKGKSLVMNLGFSHPINYPVPEGIQISVDKGTEISVKGADKEQVGQVSADIRGFRPPDSYKGKGVRYFGEYVRLKAGKSGQ